MSILRILAVSTFVSLFLIQCGPKERKAGGHMDTPETHYEQGMKLYNKGNFEAAQSSFQKAWELDHDYAPAHAGLGLCYAEVKNWDEADDHIDKSLSLDSKCVNCHIAKGIFITRKKAGGKDDDWWEDAIDAYKEALELDAKNGEAYFRMGYTYKVSYMFKEAAKSFSKCLELNNGFTKEADAHYKIVQDIERAAPGSKVGKKIALVEKINRADICALFISELDVATLIEKKRPKNYDTDFKAPDAGGTQMTVDSQVKMAKVIDIADHWAKSFIDEVVGLGVRGLQPMADHNFNPDAMVTRAEYALMLEDILIAILRDEKLATAHIGQSSSRFPDVNPSSPYYNAICNAVDKNIMDANISGEFGASNTVSGPEALLVIRKMKELKK
jgi:Tfp pilus assembly protein PilF